MLSIKDENKLYKTTDHVTLLRLLHKSRKLDQSEFGAGNTATLPGWWWSRFSRLNRCKRLFHRISWAKIWSSDTETKISDATRQNTPSESTHNPSRWI